MTIKEFYEWAMAHGAENMEIHIQYRDDGGYYYGYDDLDESDITIDIRANCVEI